MTDRILRLPAVMERTGLCRSSIYEYIAAGDFPPQVKLGPRAVGWRERDVIDWIEKRASHASKVAQ